MSLIFAVGDGDHSCVNQSRKRGVNIGSDEEEMTSGNQLEGE